MLEDLQEAFVFTLNLSPVMELENSSVANNIGHVLHLEAPHGRLPGGSYEMDVRVARTRISFRFFGRRKAISGGEGNALRSRSEV